MEFNFSEIDENFDDQQFIEEALNSFSFNDTTVFLVDIRAFQFINDNIKETNEEIVLSAYSGLIKEKIISNPKDKFSLILYNTVG